MRLHAFDPVLLGFETSAFARRQLTVRLPVIDPGILIFLALIHTRRGIGEYGGTTEKGNNENQRFHEGSECGDFAVPETTCGLPWR